MRSVEDRQLDEFIGGLLRAGVLASAVLVLIGAIVSLGQEAGAALGTPRSLAGAPGSLRTVSGILAEAMRGSGRGIIQLGVLFLVATPIARVLFSVLAFAAQRDGMYVCVTLVVLAVLGFSLFGPVSVEHGPRTGGEALTGPATVPGGTPSRSPLEPARLQAPAPRR